MARGTDHWTLEDLIDFEAKLMRSHTPTPAERQEVTAAARGLEGAAARRRGLRVWLERQRREAGPEHDSPGRRTQGACGLVTTLACLLLALSGSGAVFGLLDSSRGGMHVVVFLIVLLGVQWLVLALGVVGWLWHRRALALSGPVRGGLDRLVRRLSGSRSDGGWWQSLGDGGREARAALAWRLARITQAAGIAFNLGVLGGLTGVVLGLNVGFYWETTTASAMRSLLDGAVRWLSLPWGGWFPAAVPDAALIEATRWLPGHSGPLVPGPAAWWLFLLMAVACWGLLPRVLLWLWCWRAGRRALERLEFQGRAHRMLWRDLSTAGRVDADDRPLDGALVLDVGGTGLDREALRPFLLRRLRVNPTAWETVAVLDPGAEIQATRALANASAGVVLLAEGWALSPPRFTELLERIRATAGPHRMVKFLAVNTGPQGQPQPPTSEERREWERYVDGLRDPLTEVFAFESL